MKETRWQTYGRGPGRLGAGGLRGRPGQDGSQETVWEPEGPGPRPTLQGDLNMGFLLI